MSDTNVQAGGLRKAFSPLGIFAFSIGASIGWGSFIVTCSSFLQKSGSIGTCLGLLIGMAIVFLIGWNLQYMIQRSPNAGGVYTFQKQVGGNDLGFIAFWFVLLAYISILWANITAVPLFFRFFLGRIFQTGFQYTIFDYDVWFGEAFLSIATILVIGILCANSSRATNRIMSIAALTFIGGFAFCALTAMFMHGRPFNYEPYFTSGSSEFSLVVRIAAISPWAFIGFENIAHFSEEYNFPIKKVRGILTCSIIVTTALYILVSFLSISAYPEEYGSWIAYIKDMGNLEGIKAVPAFYAAHHYLGPSGVVILMLSLFSVILTSLIANLLALSRLLYAAGREGDAPATLSHLNAKHIPDRAIYAILVTCVLIPFLGRTAISWIVDVTTLGATITYWLISNGVYMDAKRNNLKREKFTGAAGMVLTALIMLLLLVPGFLPFHAMETESYALFIVWALLGMFYFTVLVRRHHTQQYSKSVIVWITLMMLVLFASLMWATRETEATTTEAMAAILEFHQTHPGLDLLGDGALRVKFLADQADEIISTNTLYTLFALAMFLICAGVLIYRDHRRVMQTAAAKRKLIQQTERDNVTNLYSWNYFLVYVNRIFESDKNKPMDAVIIDIDRFHSINALHGRAFGDQVLRAVAAAIQLFAHNSNGIVSRPEADRFMLYCPQREDWQLVFNQFQEHISKLFPHASIHLRMGVKPWQPGMTPEAQFDCARIACNKLRGSYTSAIAFYDHEMESRENRDHRLLNDLTGAISRGELQVYFQPKYNIQGEKPVLVSAEALVRWKHSELGMISPGEFIPLFERTGRISELDIHVWREAARQIATWRDKYGKLLPVSVNLSRLDVFSPNLFETLDGIVKLNNLSTSCLKLEVTESAYTDNPEQLIEVIHKLRAKGYKIEMDDFGSGYSSLNMLSSLPMDVLKMDIAFIRNIEHSPKDLRLVELVVDIARYLNVPVVAEGVETEGQIRLLRKEGCDIVQGFYFSRPLPAADFENNILKPVVDKEKAKG